ncbi:MAG: Arm DNA-binding domain-containing protein, partial [Bacteroidota bacterium]|nr:Arm DNA-binding domain-containing protein [Bacteroidota bacterium]
MKNKIVNHFYVKTAKTNNKGLAPIYLRITVNGQRSEISTSIMVIPETWNKISERVTGRSEHARTINSKLSNLLTKVERAFLILDNNDEKMTARMLIQQIKGSKERKHGIIEVF